MVQAYSFLINCEVNYGTSFQREKGVAKLSIPLV